MKKRILVVDDCPLILSMLFDMLDLFGFQTTGASNGHQGCQLVKEGCYDLIMTDLNMPGMDGVEFVKRVRQLPNGEQVPIIMLTGEDEQSRLEQAQNYGVSTFLGKPFQRGELKTALESVFS
ncbi:MAG: two-component system sensor histidine kinase/response regulator [Desulfuromonas sp.]|nr:MAG: two-component system sensor histidine kinase/response regulator [Desulfuromonas sp.]